MSQCDHFRVFVLRLAKCLREEDRKALVYTYHLPESCQQRGPDYLEPLLELERRGEFSRASADGLKRVLESVDRADLVGEVESYFETQRRKETPSRTATLASDLNAQCRLAEDQVRAMTMDVDAALREMKRGLAGEAAAGLVRPLLKALEEHRSSLAVCTQKCSTLERMLSWSNDEDSGFTPRQPSTAPFKDEQESSDYCLLTNCHTHAQNSKCTDSSPASSRREDSLLLRRQQLQQQLHDRARKDVCEEMRENRLKKSRIPKPRILQSPALRPKRKECEGRKISQQPHRPLDSRITAETSDYHSATDVSSGSDYTLSSSGSMTSDGEIREWRQHTLSASSDSLIRPSPIARSQHYAPVIPAKLNKDNPSCYQKVVLRHKP